MARKSHMYNAIPAGFESDEENMENLMSNLKIKRLEDITTGAGIDGCNFDATLDAKAEEFLSCSARSGTCIARKSRHICARNLEGL